MSDFSKSIMELRYSWDKEDGTKETWNDICDRVVNSVFSVADFEEKDDIKRKLLQYMYQRKFIPGGRFLAQSGRDYHQTNNCFLLRAEDTREGWATLLEKATLMLMSGGGIGIDYSELRPKGAKLKRSGGVSSGPLPLMKTINEVGRGVMAGGSRRSAIWAGLRWNHGDIFDFITMKNWQDEVKRIKEKDFDFPASMDMTNISVILDKDFFDAYDDSTNPLHEHAQKVYWMTIEQMVKTAEPGFSVDYDNPKESLRNACFSYDTPILTENGYMKMGDISGKKINIVSADGTISKGKIWKSGVKNVIELNLSTNEKIRCTPDHVFMDVDGNSVFAENMKGKQLFPFLKTPNLLDEFILLGFVQGDGQLTRLNSDFHLGIEVNIGKDDEDILPFFDKYVYKWQKSGEGKRRVIYVNGLKNRLQELGFDAKILPERGLPSTYDSWNKLEKASFINGCFSANGTINNHGRICYKSTSRAMIDGLVETLENDFGISSYVTTNKSHPIKFSNGTYVIKESYDINISSFKDKLEFFNNIGFSLNYKTEKLSSKLFEMSPYVKSIKDAGIEDVYDFNEPINNWGVVHGFVVHNCTEIVSEDDSDVCCLGSINLPRIKDLEELDEITELSQLFLILGIIYSDVPHQKVKEVKEKNMRTGLGIMGFHEWLIRNEEKYEPNEKLGEWLNVWKKSSDDSARKWSKKLGVNEPIKKRSLAPNGSISIAGGKTTSGIEPIFSLAYQRRYLTPDGWRKQYVVDAVAERLHEEGYDLSKVEDAYSLSYDVEKRIAFQAFVQSYVDNAISSTINLPEFGTEGNNDPKEFGEILMKYLPKLRGITVYPDGARGGQPLTPVPFDFAINKKGVVFESHEECVGGVCGL